MTTTELSVLRRRTEDLIESGREQAQGVLDRLQADRIDDAVVPIGPGANGEVPSVHYDGEQVGVSYRGRVRSFHPHAAMQFGAKLGIPSAWLRESLAGEPWQRELIADVMATALARTPHRGRLLLRSVGGQVRGVLSDQYRRLDSPLIASGFAEVCRVLGAVPYRARASDISWSVSAMIPDPIEVTMPNHGTGVVRACVGADAGAGTVVRRSWGAGRGRKDRGPDSPRRRRAVCR